MLTEHAEHIFQVSRERKTRGCAQACGVYCVIYPAREEWRMLLEFERCEEYLSSTCLNVFVVVVAYMNLSSYCTPCTNMQNHCSPLAAAVWMKGTACLSVCVCVCNVWMCVEHCTLPSSIFVSVVLFRCASMVRWISQRTNIALFEVESYGLIVNGFRCNLECRLWCIIYTVYLK